MRRRCVCVDGVRCADDRRADVKRRPVATASATAIKINRGADYYDGASRVELQDRSAGLWWQGPAATTDDTARAATPSTTSADRKFTPCTTSRVRVSHGRLPERPDGYRLLRGRLRLRRWRVSLRWLRLSRLYGCGGVAGCGEYGCGYRGCGGGCGAAIRLRRRLWPAIGVYGYGGGGTASRLRGCGYGYRGYGGGYGYGLRARAATAAAARQTGPALRLGGYGAVAATADMAAVTRDTLTCRMAGAGIAPAAADDKTRAGEAPARV